MGPAFLGTVKTLLLAQALLGTVTGRVWDSETSEPVAGAVVTLPDLDRSVQTNEAGRYVLRQVPPGEHPLTIQFIGYASRAVHALVPRGGKVEIDLWLLPAPVRIGTIDVRAPARALGPDTPDMAAFPDHVVTAAAMRSNPFLAEPDAFGAFTYGEVSLRQETPSGVNVRGGASDQTGYLLDGIPVFNPYHAGGISAGWNPDALSRLLLISTATVAECPNALSGVIEGTTRAPGERLQAEGSVSTTQWRAALAGPFGSAAQTDAGYLVSLRLGLPDAFAPKDDPTYVRGETGDWLVKLESRALAGGLELLGYGNENELSGIATVPPEDGAAGDPRRNTFAWSGRSLGARWAKGFSNMVVRVLGWKAEGGASSIWAGQTGGLDLAANRVDYGALLGVQLRTERGTTDATVRAEEARAAYRVVSDSTSGPHWSFQGATPVVTAVGQHRRAVGSHFDLGLGGSISLMRADPYLGSNAQITWKASDRFRLSGSYARMHQFTQSLRNPESVAGNVFPADIYVGAGTAGVPVGRARLGVIAAMIEPRAGLRLSAQAYDRHSEDLVLVAPTESAPFATGPFRVGSGVSRGASLDAAVSARRFGIVAGYGLEHVRLEAEGSSYVPESGAAQTARFGVIVLPRPTLSVRLASTVVLGRRGTIHVGGFEWEANNLLDRGSEFGGSPASSPGALGGTTLPAYWGVDLGVRKEWRVAWGGRGGTMALFGTATNLLGRKNVLTYSTDPSTGERTAIEMRPLSPLVVGLDWSF